MEEFALIGYPLGHSFSKKYFTEKFEREGIDARYELLPIEDISLLPQVLEAHPHLRGFNVTIPYKQAIIPYLDDLSDDARAMGAVNVVKVERRDNAIRLIGYNSDYVGFRNSLEPLLDILQAAAESQRWLVPGNYPGPALGANLCQPLQALILGTGGASKAVAYALEELDIPYCFVSRKSASAVSSEAASSEFALSELDALPVLSYQDLDESIMRDYQIIVNTTPLGMSPHTEACADIPYHCLRKHHLLYDVVYNPEETLFLKKGKEQGAFTKNGLEMLYGQAQEAWRIWNE